MIPFVNWLLIKHSTQIWNEHENKTKQNLSNSTDIWFWFVFSWEASTRAIQLAEITWNLSTSLICRLVLTSIYSRKSEISINILSRTQPDCWMFNQIISTWIRNDLFSALFCFFCFFLQGLGQTSGHQMRNERIHKIIQLEHFHVDNRKKHR